MGWRDRLGLQPKLDDFVRLLLRHPDVPGGWEYVPDEGLLRSGDGVVVSLQNLFVEYGRADRVDRAALMDKYASLFGGLRKSAPALWTMAEDQVFPVLRSVHDRPVSALLMPATGGNAWIAWPWVGDLEIRLVFDHGQYVSSVMREQADVWGQSEERLRDQALANLRSLATPWWTDGPVHRLESPDGYTESIMLHQACLAALPFASSAVCIAPNRGVLLAVDGRNETDVVAMLELAFESMRDAPWPLSSVPIEFPADGPRVYVVPAAARPAAHRLERLGMSITYAGQKEAFEKAHQAEGRDIFVAPYDMIRRSEHGLDESWCTWVEGIDSLLPRTDLVALSDEADRPFLAPWDVVIANAGDLLAATDDMPVRYRPLSYPPTDVIRAIKAASS